MLRRSAATAALVTLALGAPAWPQGTGVFTLAGPPDQEVEIEADRMVYGWEAQTLQLEGQRPRLPGGQGFVLGSGLRRRGFQQPGSDIA